MSSPIAGIHLQPGALSSAGATTLQNAYDNSLGAVPMVLLDGVPTPMTFRASVPGSAFEVQDVAGQAMFEVDIDPDLIVARSGVTIENAFDNGGSSASLILTDTFTAPAFVGGGIQSLGTVTYAASTFIWALLQESKGYIANVGPGFAAFTLFNAIPFIRNGTNNALVQALVLNVGLSHQATGANAVTTAQTIGVSFSANTRALTARGTMTKTVGDIGFSFGPTHGTVLGSTVNHGTLIGFRCLNPTVPLFQSGAGVETMTAYIGMEINAIPFGGNVTKRGIRSFLVAATNTRFIDGQGTAESDFRGNVNMLGDLVVMRFGASQDWQQGWAAGGFYFEQQLTGAGGQFRKSFPAAGRMLFDWSVATELNINAVRFSFGQSGAVGNQVGVFVANARTIGVAGEWADFLLTQAGSLTVGGNAMSRVSAWVINGISYASSSGSVTEADTLTVGGFPTSSPGVTITNRQSLNVIAGRSRFASIMQQVPISPATLAAGDTNDYAGLLTGSANNNMRGWARLSGDGGGTSALTGIDSTSAQDGDVVFLTNVSANNITLRNQNAGSAASNRIITGTGADYVLGPDEEVACRWDATTDRWRLGART